MVKLFQDSNRPRLKPLGVSGYTEPLELVDGKLTLGRSADNDISLRGEDFPSVSNHHARIELAEERLELFDLGSKNGTWVNGAQVERARLKTGDVIQLGSIGPRFVIVTSSPLSETMFVDPKAVGLLETKTDSSHKKLHDIVHRKTRRQAISLAALAVLGTISVILWGRHLANAGRAGEERLGRELVAARQEREQRLAELSTWTSAIEQLGETREQEIERVREEYERRLMDLEQQRERVAEDRRLLQARFDRLEAEGTASVQMLETLQEQLDLTRNELSETQASFELIDPVNLEQARLEGVRRVRSAIVLLEVELQLRHRESGILLHVADEQGIEIPNLDGVGEPWSMDSTGSGFVVDERGWIITNAHVVGPSDARSMLEAAREMDMDPILSIHAVFSGGSIRHPVDVVRVADAPGEDLALVKIEPYPGMPYIKNFSIDAAAPPAGSDVYLFGFPLGNYALQQGETVIASTFRGIMSRFVGGRMQVDAGVHPGNSGGPVTDSRGRVIGVVYSVQALPDQSAVYTIGYAIPIFDAWQVWPPPEVWPPADVLSASSEDRVTAPASLPLPADAAEADSRPSTASDGEE